MYNKLIVCQNKIDNLLKIYAFLKESNRFFITFVSYPHLGLFTIIKNTN